VGMEITKRLADFSSETMYEKIPEEVLQFTKGLILKTVAGMLAGSTMPSAKKVTKVIKDRKLAGEAGVIGCGFKTSIWEAIFLNAFFAHNSELEDDRINGGASWDITVIPLLFPLAENLKLSGRSLLEATAVGLEVHVRTCLFPTAHVGIAVFPGAVGPAVAAAKAFGLSTEQTSAAIGLALQGASVVQQNLGTDSHYFESALQSLQGHMAAELAGIGMTSNPDIAKYISGVLGEDKVVPEKMIQNLGGKWMLQDISVKRYPCCLFNHRQLNILLELMKQNNLSYEDIEMIEVHISPADELCNRPEPKTMADLQFSFQHVLGAAMLDGDVDFRHTNDIGIVRKPRYREARSKVKVIGHPDRSTSFMEEPAHVVVRTKDGREYSGTRKYAIGSPAEPMAIEEFPQLYRKFTKGILTSKQIERTSAAIQNLEGLNDIEELMHILTFRKIS